MYTYEEKGLKGGRNGGQIGPKRVVKLSTGKKGSKREKRLELWGHKTKIGRKGTKKVIKGATNFAPFGS